MLLDICQRRKHGARLCKQLHQSAPPFSPLPLPAAYFDTIKDGWEKQNPVLVSMAEN